MPTSAVDLKISGMSCGACVARIERVVKRVPGVKSVAVNLGTERAHVAFDADCEPTDAVIDAIGKAGFGAQRLGPATAPDIQEAVDARAQETEWVMFGISVALTLPLLWDMVAHMTALPGHVPPLWQLVLGTLIQFIPGLRFYKGAWKALKSGYGTMDTLVALGTTAAYGLSVWRVANGQAGDGLYFESAAVVVTLVLLGKILEGRARRSAASAIRTLMSLQPNIAHVERDGRLLDVNVAELRSGDTVLVRLGEIVPADGVIVDGPGDLEESLITGESLPVTRQIGDRVIGGSLLVDGTIRVALDATGDETTLARLIRVVEQAQSAKPPIQRFADKVAGIFVPIVLAIAAVTFLGWWLGAGELDTAFRAAISVLVIACPCALGLATPTAIMVGTGLAAKRGILIRDSVALERTRDIQTLVFDKTGTLTEGKPKLVQVVRGAEPDVAEDDGALLGLAASVQRNANHPLARALRDASEERGCGLLPTADFESRTGSGVSARVARRRIFLGSRAWMDELGVDRSGLESSASTIEDAGVTVVWMAGCDDSGERTDNLDQPTALALFGIADPPKAKAGRLVAWLKSAGIQPVMLTGDTVAVASAIGARIGLEEIRAGVRPEGKADVIRDLQKSGKVVAMVGDGVNDTPALATADVGIAMGTGADAAMETAGVTLLHGDISLIADAISLSKATVARIRTNLVWAFGYNALAIPLAAAGLLSPMIAGAAMALSSVSVVASSLMLRRWKPEQV